MAEDKAAAPAALHTMDEFEAGVWNLLTAHKATVPDGAGLVDGLLGLARAYVTSDSQEVTGLRRQVLARGRSGGRDGRTVMKLRIYGVPAPQGSTRAFAVRKGGVLTGAVAVTHGDKDKVRSWRRAIADEVRAQMGTDWEASYAGQNSHPMAVAVTFIAARPAAHFGTGRNAGVLKASAPERPVGRPDVDKLARAVLDALTEAGVWKDDCQVVELTGRKVYAGPGVRPGAEIEITACG